jgi:hypothetical protein
VFCIIEHIYWIIQMISLDRIFGCYVAHRLKSAKGRWTGMRLLLGTFSDPTSAHLHRLSRSTMVTGRSRSY